MATDKPRIVIYGTGQFGCHIARFAHQKGWPIVAAYNRAGPKVGQDLGQVAGIGKDIGVIVQDCDTASYEKLQADVGIVTMTDRLSLNMPAYKRLLNAGLNVLCHGVEAYYPWGCDKALADEIDALAKKNKVTFSGSGIWDPSRIWSGILAAGPCTDLRALHHTSITDNQRTGKALMLFTGAGLTVEQFKEKQAGAYGIVRTYKTIPEHVLHALGYTVTADRVRIEPVVFDEPYYAKLLEREIPAGDCVGTRIIAEIDTKEGVTADATIELRCFKEGEVENMFWAVDGMPHTRIRVEREDSAHFTAACLFNRVRDAMAAPPGIVLVSQMGPMKHTALG